MVAIATAISGAFKVLEKLWAKRQSRNGNGHASSAASQKLEKWDMEWRKDVDDELEKFQSAIYEPEGALRKGDHSVREDTQAAISRMAVAMLEQHRELRADVKALAGEVKDLGKAVAARTSCCEHCEA